MKFSTRLKKGMRIALVGIATLAVCVPIQMGIVRVMAGSSNREQPGWLTDYGQALSLARQTGKPVLVVFRCQH